MGTADAEDPAPGRQIACPQGYGPCDDGLAGGHRPASTREAGARERPPSSPWASPRRAAASPVSNRSGYCSPRSRRGDGAGPGKAKIAPVRLNRRASAPGLIPRSLRSVQRRRGGASYYGLPHCYDPRHRRTRREGVGTRLRPPPDGGVVTRKRRRKVGHGRHRPGARRRLPWLQQERLPALVDQRSPSSPASPARCSSSP